MLQHESGFFADLDGGRIGVVGAAAHSIGLAIGLARFAGQGHFELKVLGLVAQITGNGLGDIQLTSGVDVREGVVLRLVLTFSVNGSNAQLAIFAVNNGHNQLNVVAIVGNASGGASNFLQGVLILANLLIAGQRNGDIAGSARNGSSARSKGRAGDGAQGGSGSRVAVRHGTIAILHKGEGISGRSSIIVGQLIGLFNGHGSHIGIGGGFLGHRRSHAQHEHEGQEDRYKLFHGFVSLLVSQFFGFLYHSRRVEPG